MSDASRLVDGWPEGRPLAISVNIMLEGWTDDSAPGIGPMGNPLKAGVLDLQARSWAEYGPKIGAWRILDLLAAAEVRAVWYVSGIVAERYPALITAIADRGHRVAAHGWSQDIIPAYQSDEQEIGDLRRCTDVLSATAKQSPRGWLSPRCTPSSRTSRLLAEAGYGWHADTFDSDVPYILKTAAGPITAMPFTMEVNDMPLYVRYGNEPEAFTRVLEKIVSNWASIGNHPGCLDITIHAHVFGRPYGLIEFRNAIALARQSPGVWLCDHAALAALYGPVSSAPS
jgi:peptidoglycan/xylan/chitin deacetylase (PgdA/CDA1 family)